MAELVLSFSRFAQSVKPGHQDRIWLGPLRLLHGSEKHTAAQWWALVALIKQRPAKR